MLGLYRIFKAIIIIIWIIDILNINFVINGVNVASFLDVTVPLNGWFWFLIFLFLPSSEIIYKSKKGED